MKEDVHPVYGPVAFRDSSTGETIVTCSTLAARIGGPTVELDGHVMPLVQVDVTSGSHPFWTGRRRTLDTEGRVEKFNRRYGKSQQ